MPGITADLILYNANILTLDPKLPAARQLPLIQDVIVVTQPFFLYTMGGQFLKEVETRNLKWLFPLKSFIKNSVKTAISSDSPLLPASPFKGIYSAITRKERSGKIVWEI